MELTTSLPREVIETQLSRIIDSSQFRNAPRLSRFLTYVVDQSLAGRAEHLKGYTIGLEVFDKPDDFDPQTPLPPGGPGPQSRFFPLTISARMATCCSLPTA